MRSVRLYYSTRIEDEERRDELSGQVLAYLQAAGWKVLGSFPGGKTVYLQAGYEGQYRLWFICDNGGEFNVGLVNGDDMRSIPYTYYSMILDAETMGYRLLCALRGDAIDYDFRAVA